MLCATTDRFRSHDRRAHLPPGHGARDGRDPRPLPVAYGGPRGADRGHAPSTWSPTDIHDWALAEFRSTSPWAVGQAVAALGRHHSRPWLSRIDVPTAVVVTLRRQGAAPGQPDRARPPDPGRHHPRHRRRSRRLRAGVRAVRARPARGGRPPSTPGAATSPGLTRIGALPRLARGGRRTDRRARRPGTPGLRRGGVPRRRSAQPSWLDGRPDPRASRPFDHPLPDGCPVTHRTRARSCRGLDRGPRPPGRPTAASAALDRVAGCTDEETRGPSSPGALHDQLAAGVDHGPRPGRPATSAWSDAGTASAACRRGRAHDRRVRAAARPAVGGHCHFMGGEVSGAERRSSEPWPSAPSSGVDVVKVMASGGVNTPGCDVMLTQFTTDELRLVVDLAHRGRAPGDRARARHARRSSWRVAAGVDGIEHCSCVTDRGFGQVSDDVGRGTRPRAGSRSVPTVGVDPREMHGPTSARPGDRRTAWRVPRPCAMHRGPAGLRGPAAPRRRCASISGVDSGHHPGASGTGCSARPSASWPEAGIAVAEAVAHRARPASAEAIGLGARKGAARRRARRRTCSSWTATSRPTSTALLRPAAVLLRGVAGRLDRPPVSGRVSLLLGRARRFASDRGRRLLGADTAAFSAASSAGNRRTRSSTSGIDSRHAMIPTCTLAVVGHHRDVEPGAVEDRAERVERVDPGAHEVERHRRAGHVGDHQVVHDRVLLGAAGARRTPGPRGRRSAAPRTPPSPAASRR